MNLKTIDIRIDAWASRHSRICKILGYGAVTGCISAWYLVHAQYYGFAVATMAMVPFALLILYLRWDAVKVKLYRLWIET